MSRPSGCNHEDWPCCGCGNEPTQEAQHEQFTELDGALDGLDAFEETALIDGGDIHEEGEEPHERMMSEMERQTGYPGTFGNGELEGDTPMGEEYGNGFDHEG